MEGPLFKVIKKKKSEDFGTVVIEPLDRGYGQTLGTALRRVLLTSMPGAAVTQVAISGVRHQFFTLEGLKEDIIDFILNLKQLRIQYSGDKPVKLTLNEVGPKKVTAADIKTPAGLKIVNQDLVLGSLADKKNKLRAEITVESGFGYSPAEERKAKKIGQIPVDASFSPIRRVNYQVEAMRVGRRTDLDRLIIQIETNGTIDVNDAFKRAAEILVGFFKQVASPKKMPKVKKAEDQLLPGVMELTVEELDLPTRIANALRKGGYGTLGDLTAATQVDLAKVKNLGTKSIKVVENALTKKGVSLKGK
jgi:DNA-directed RNA polymerase subunit alpha